jgi:catecholate siderophore receptor
VSGIVRDSSGAGVPRATIIVRPESGRLDHLMDAARDGTFVIGRLTPGPYVVTASAPGFASVTERVEIPSVEPLILTRAPAPIIEQVTVVSASRQKELRDSLNTRVDVITRSRIDETGGHETVGEILRELPGVVTRCGRRRRAQPASRFKASTPPGTPSMLEVTMRSRRMRSLPIGARARSPLWVRVLCGILCTTALSAPGQAAAQESRVVSGTVLDATGAAISGAAATLATTAGERRTTTDRIGSFSFDNVAPGDTTLTVTFDRFAPFTMSLGGPRRDLRIVLEPLPLREAVTVEAPALTAPRTTTATRTETPLRDVPQAVSVITRGLIADQTMDSMADVVAYVPGVGMAQGEGHRDAPIFRGNTSTADFFVDGLRDDTQYLRDVYNVERVEVLRGPNGMVFGRGGVGGVINRVTRQADWTPTREVTLEGGSWTQRRFTADVGGAANGTVAARVAGMYENADTYRDGADLERYGVNPTVAFALGSRTTLRAGYEFFQDERVNDRGVPSFQGRPLATDPSTFFGNPDVNRARIHINALSSIVEHKAGSITLRNSTRYADYDKYYQNLVPGAVNAARTTLVLTGYSSGTDRRNVFNQTDVIIPRQTGRIEHTFLVGAELGRQVTDNLRLTAFFPTVTSVTTSIALPLDNPRTTLPVEFRISAREQDNDGVATTAAVYAQDQVALSQKVHATVGVRYDRFDVDFRDNRTGSRFASTDGLISPRLALIYKPITPVSLYASYARASLPRAGEQLSSLTLSTRALDPETFRNYELGAKWELTPALSFTTAVYRLDHGNVVVRDPVNPTLSHLVDAERSTGLELEVSGTVVDRWSVHGGYAYQQAEITRSLSAAVVAGNRLGQVPAHSFSLWNRYDVSRMWGVGLGIISRSESFVATDNAVVLPAFARVDAAVFFNITPRVRLHVNVENLFDERYYPSAHNNNNIAPGSPRAARVALTTRF